jgi:hypothetical protein
MADDAIAVLTRKLETLAEVTATLKLDGEKLRWVVSDDDVGLVQAMGKLADVIEGLKESREDHEARIKAQEARHALEDKGREQIRQPAIALFFSLLEKLIFAGLAGALAWLWAIKK